MANQQLDTQVIIAGAGPVGLMLAGELRLAGVSVVIVERLARPMTESRASQLNTRTAEIMHERGLDRLLDEAQWEPNAHFGGLPFDISRVDSPYAGNWKVPQYRTEEVLTDRALNLGAELFRAHELCGLTVTQDHVICEVDGPLGKLRLRADYLVGCDGETSMVRRLAAFDFPATEATKELLRADVTGIEIANRRFERFEHGLAIAVTREKVTRVMVHEFGRVPFQRMDPPEFAEFAEIWTKVTGEDISGGKPIWVDAFDNARGQVTQYRKGRVLLAGDAAHRHMPIGGQALNLGLQDAVNLGWKLAGMVNGWAPPELLDSYQTERHPLGARILGLVAAQELLLLGGHEVEPLRTVLSEILSFDEARDYLAGWISGVDIRYGCGNHPLVGRRMPTVGVLTGSGTTSTAEILASGRGILLDQSAPGSDRADIGKVAGTAWESRLRLGRAARPQGGEAGHPSTVLVRPDGYVAWADGDQSVLDAALGRWFGDGTR
jgi:2-polyprenyl-6-methoxyphenol hydroxylase-like FAD-dependent oxidoreductase